MSEFKRVNRKVDAYGISVMAGIIFGLAPTIQASKANNNRALKGTRRISDEFRRRHFCNLLVAAEVALAFVLLVGAGLLVRYRLRLDNLTCSY
jgi:hypothetical protein